MTPVEWWNRFPELAVFLVILPLLHDRVPVTNPGQGKLVGFIGRWRDRGESNLPIDASGLLPNGTRFDGPAGLRAELVKAPEQFMTTVTEKLLTYAVGRGLEYYDGPAVRQIIRDSALGGHRWSELIFGIVESTPFQMRRSSDAGGSRAQ